MNGTPVMRTNTPAYPTTRQGDGNRFLFEDGMTLRDYFAASAMQGMLANPATRPEDAVTVVETAWAFADAMLVERARD